MLLQFSAFMRTFNLLTTSSRSRSNSSRRSSRSAKIGDRGILETSDRYASSIPAQSPDAPSSRAALMSFRQSRRLIVRVSCSLERFTFRGNFLGKKRQLLGTREQGGTGRNRKRVSISPLLSLRAYRLPLGLSLRMISPASTSAANGAIL
ncbi:hypothetical protein D3C71_1238000 [compost metagenome]